MTTMTSLFSVDVDPDRLGEVFWNLGLFTPKSGVTEGRALMVSSVLGLDFYASDGFVSIRDQIGLDVNPNSLDTSLLLEIAGVSAAEKWLRKATDLVRVSIEDGQLVISGLAPELVEQEVFIQTYGYNDDPWGTIGGMVESELSSPTTIDHYRKWALNPDRLANMKRLKAGDNPIDLRMMSYPGFEDVALWQFMIGENLRGVIAPMDRELLKVKSVPTWDSDGKSDV